ncbi:hypothetical protein, partial [Amycolatopsis sp. NPDC003861]
MTRPVCQRISARWPMLRTGAPATVGSWRRSRSCYHVKFAFARADEVVKEIRYDRVIGCTGF